MSLAYVSGTDYETEAGVYWTDECRKGLVYAPGIEVAFYKKPIGHLFYWIGKLAGDFVRNGIF